MWNQKRTEKGWNWKQEAYMVHLHQDKSRILSTVLLNISKKKQKTMLRNRVPAYFLHSENI